MGQLHPKAQEEEMRQGSEVTKSWGVWRRLSDVAKEV